MDNQEQSGASGKRPSSPNIVQLELKGELTSIVTQQPSDDARNGGKLGSGKDASLALEEVRKFRISCLEDSQHFCSNYIKTTKYTLISWLPLATLY